MIRDAPGGNACGACSTLRPSSSPSLIIFFVYTALRDEPLPELLFSPQKRAFKALKESEKEKARDRQKKLAARSHRKSKLAASQVKLNQGEGIRAAFYVPWDAASFSSLRAYAHQIDMLYPDWLHVLTADGRLQGVDDQTNKYFDVVQGNDGPAGRRPGDAVSEDGRPRHGSLPHGEQFRRRELGGRHRRVPEQSRCAGAIPAASVAVSFVRATTAA